MKNFLKAALVMFAASFSFQHNARAASVAVDVDIDIPSILILYCYDNIDVTVTSAAMIALLGVASADGTVTNATPAAITAAHASGALFGTAGAPDTTLPSSVDLTNINLDMDDICGFRAIRSSGGTGVNVSAAITTASMQDATTTSTITMNDAAVRSVAGGFTALGGTEAVSTGFALGTVTPIDLRVNLDLSGVVLAGNHTDGVVTVTAALF